MFMDVEAGAFVAYDTELGGEGVGVGRPIVRCVCGTEGGDSERPVLDAGEVKRAVEPKGYGDGIYWAANGGVGGSDSDWNEESDSVGDGVRCEVMGAKLMQFSAKWTRLVRLRFEGIIAWAGGGWRDDMDGGFAGIREKGMAADVLRASKPDAPNGDTICFPASQTYARLQSDTLAGALCGSRRDA